MSPSYLHDASSIRVYIMCRRAGGPLKGVQALKASLEALQSLRRLPFRHESIASSTGAAAHLAAWQTVAEAVQVLLRECLIACPGQHACARACATRVSHTWLRAQSIAVLTILLQGLLKEMATLPAGVALAGNKTVCKDTVKGFYRQALRLKPKVYVFVNAYHCVQLDSIITCCAD